MPDMLGPGRRILASQPFSVLVDAELLRLGDGHAELRIPIRAELKQQRGFVHGGVISCAADKALTFAGGSAWEPASWPPSSRSTTCDVPGAKRWSRAPRSFMRTDGPRPFCRCDIFSSEGGSERLCATAQGTIAKLPMPSENPSRAD